MFTFYYQFQTLCANDVCLMIAYNADWKCFNFPYVTHGISKESFYEWKNKIGNHKFYLTHFLMIMIDYFPGCNRSIVNLTRWWGEMWSRLRRECQAKSEGSRGRGKYWVGREYRTGVMEEGNLVGREYQCVVISCVGRLSSIDRTDINKARLWDLIRSVPSICILPNKFSFIYINS